MLLTKEELKEIEIKENPSVYKKVKKVNSFLNKDWNRYWEAYNIVKNGNGSWPYAVPISDIKFFELYVRQR